MTDKSDDRVGHLNTILARGGGNLNDPIFKKSNAPALSGGMLKLRVDWCIKQYPWGFFGCHMYHLNTHVLTPLPD